MGGAKTGGAKSAGMSSLKRRCPADIPEDMTKEVQDLAVKTFKALGCMGVSRIDFLMNADTKQLWVTEINTIPGSLAFYLWEETGVNFAELLDRMISLAFKRQRTKESLTFTYDTNISPTSRLAARPRAKRKRIGNKITAPEEIFGLVFYLSIDMMSLYIMQWMYREDGFCWI